jgi:Low molecular weight phosphotyrosine protein phosphatase
MAWLTAIATSVADVLFVCIRNAGRSNMTTGLLDHAPQGALWVRSAGSEPADRLKPAVVEESAGRRRRNVISGDRRGLSVDPDVISVDSRGNWG